MRENRESPCPPAWLITVYLMHTIGELCLSPVGLSAMTKLAPAKVVSQMLGIWFLATSLGNFIGGQVAGVFEKFPLPWIFGERTVPSHPRIRALAIVSGKKILEFASTP